MVLVLDMKLPRAWRAIVERSKVRDYLLSRTHAVGRNKAAFFIRVGYRPADWRALARDLRDHACRGETLLVSTSPFGRRFEVRGSLKTPTGSRVSLLSVWIWREGEIAPRFVTAYPQRKP
jgi:hypothetical protein